jgi:hypothetical protein
MHSQLSNEGGNKMTMGIGVPGDKPSYTGDGTIIGLLKALRSNTPAGAKSGQKVVATVGAAVPLGSQAVNASLLVKALTTNIGLVYVGNDGAGDVNSANGYPLAAGDQIIFGLVSNLSAVIVDSAVNGEGVAWLILNA